jgi:hypothetical protein
VNPSQWLSIIPDVAAILAVLVAAAGLFYTGKQLELSRKAAGAELLLLVDEALREFDGTVLGLRDGSLKGDERDVQRLMGAMERLHFLVAKGLVDAADMDDMHGWRLEALLSNEYVSVYIKDYPQQWRRLTDLERLFAETRTRFTQHFPSPPAPPLSNPEKEANVEGS